MFWKQIPLLTQSNICANLLLAERKAQDQFLFSHNPPSMSASPAVCIIFRFSFFVSASCLSELFGTSDLAQKKVLHKVSAKW